MAETLLVEAASWGSVYRSFNGDGTSSYWANSFLPIWGRLCALAEYLEYDVSKVGSTLTGSELIMQESIVFEGAGSGVVLRNPASLSDGSVTVNMAFNVYIVAALTADRTYTIPDPTRGGEVIYIVKRNNAAFDAIIQRADASEICTFDNTISPYAAAAFISREASSTFKWGLLSFSAAVVPQHDAL
jgi:hypothetical protein